MLCRAMKKYFTCMWPRNVCTASWKIKSTIGHSGGDKHVLSQILRISIAGCCFDYRAQNVEICVAVLPACSRCVGSMVFGSGNHVLGHRRIIGRARRMRPVFESSTVG